MATRRASTIILRPMDSRRRQIDVPMRALFITTLLVLCGAAPHGQTHVPPAASIDIAIPSAPTPVRIAGRMHLAYELHITNFRNVELALTRIEILGGDRTATPLAS